MSHDSSVGTGSRLRVERSRNRGSTWNRDKNPSSFPKRRDALGHTQPPMQWIPLDVSWRVKQLGRVAERSLPFSAEFGNAGIYTSSSPTLLYGIYKYSASLLLSCAGESCATTGVQLS
jgi:hypothetical protein